MRAGHSTVLSGVSISVGEPFVSSVHGSLITSMRSPQLAGFLPPLHISSCHMSNIQLALDLLTGLQLLTPTYDLMVTYEADTHNA